jgi:hypothetical protein
MRWSRKWDDWDNERFQKLYLNMDHRKEKHPYPSLPHVGTQSCPPGEKFFKPPRFYCKVGEAGWGVLLLFKKNQKISKGILME